MTVSPHPLCRSRRTTPTEEQARKEQQRLDRIRRLKANGLQDKVLYAYTFDKADNENPALQYAHRYVKHWAEVKAQGQGLLFGGGVGTGKTFAAACIANALTENAETTKNAIREIFSKEDSLSDEGAFQHHQHGNHERQNQAYAEKRDTADASHTHRRELENRFPSFSYELFVTIHG